MIPLLGALAAAALWYAFTWGVTHYPLVMADILIYGLAPAAVGFAGWSMVWMWRTSRADDRARRARLGDDGNDATGA